MWGRWIFILLELLFMVPHFCSFHIVVRLQCSLLLFEASYFQAMNIYWKPAISFNVQRFCTAEAWESLANGLWVSAGDSMTWSECPCSRIRQMCVFWTWVLSACDLGLFLSHGALDMGFNIIKVSLHMVNYLSFQHDKWFNHCSFQFPYWNTGWILLCF